MNTFANIVSTFQGHVLPEKEMSLAGYVALIKTYDLKVPLPHKLSLISQRHKRYDVDNWSVYTPRYKPDDTFAGHLTFALRYEGLDLAVLKALFAAIDAQEISAWIKREPTGQYSRRIWFLYEWLMSKELDVPDLTSGNFVDVLNDQQQYACQAILKGRYRVRNNLPGVPGFCPLVRRTDKLEACVKQNLSAVARTETANIRPDILARAAAFLLLKDSRASFNIEGEDPDYNRVAGWGQIIGLAGSIPLSEQELLRLQRIVLGNTKFVKFGFRKDGGFVGTHDRVTFAPMPDHISAKWNDLPALINALIDANKVIQLSALDPVIAAAMIAFGFVFIHPFVDGNGRIHRYLIHHVLAERGFTNKGLVFPVSSAMLENLDAYRKVLESYSRPRLNHIDWCMTAENNIEVLNNTIDLYSYFDATQQAEFLYDCVAHTIEKTLPEEILYLECYDKMRSAINQRFNMPERTIDLLIRFLEQSGGRLSKRAKEKEFSALSDKECVELEELYSAVFNA